MAWQQVDKDYDLKVGDTAALVLWMTAPNNETLKATIRSAILKAKELSEGLPDWAEGELAKLRILRVITGREVQSINGKKAWPLRIEFKKILPGTPFHIVAGGIVAILAAVAFAAYVIGKSYEVVVGTPLGKIAGEFTPFLVVAVAVFLMFKYRKGLK